MSLFGKKKTNAEQVPCCGEAAEAPAAEECRGTKADGGCSIKVLGAGCKSCHQLYENVRQTAAALGMDAEVEYVTDMEQVMAYGVMSLPALVVNGQVVSAGKVLKDAELRKLLANP